MTSSGCFKTASGAEWGLWANEQAVISSIILFVGAIVGVSGMFDNWQFAAAVMPAAFLVFLIEWPRGCRLNGKHTNHRCGQDYLTTVVKSIEPLKNYVLRAIFMLIVSVPSCFLLPTSLGGLSLAITAVIYLIAAANGENWKPMKKSMKNEDDRFPPPPASPPPRNPEIMKKELIA